MPALHGIATITRAPSPIDDCRAVDDAAGVLSVTLWARRDRDAVRARLLSALSAFPGPDVRVAPDRLSTIVIRNGELLAIRRVLAGLGQLVIEHDAVDDRGVDVDPYSTQIHLEVEHAREAEQRLAAAGFVVLDHQQTLVRLEAFERAAAQAAADQLTTELHVVARAVPMPITRAVIDRDRATDLGVDVRDVETAIADESGARQLSAFEPAMIALPGTPRQRLDATSVRARSGERIPLSHVVTLLPTIAPAELVTIGEVPAIELRVSDSPETIAAVLAAHPVPPGVTVTLVQP